VQDHHGAAAVATVRLVSPGERRGQTVPVDAAVHGELVDDRAGHLGVIGPRPGAGRLICFGDVGDGGARHEELGADRVADGQPVEAFVTEVE
jgi:hypothetical protein